MPDDICVTVGGHVFNYRVAAVIKQQGRVLTCRFHDESWCFLPGGRVAAGETSEDALRRELREELGELCRSVRPLFLMENFFNLDGRAFHEVGVYYLTELDAWHERGWSAPIENRTLHFEWVNVADLASVNLQPAVLRERLHTLPAHLEHVITRIE